jgi:hypothetical protein
MSSSEKLGVLATRDSLLFALLTAYFFIPGDYGIFIVLGGTLLVERLARNKLKGAPRLEQPHRKIYFIISESFLAIWILLIARWVIRHLSPIAIAIGALTVVVLLAYSLYVHHTIYGKDATV